MLGIYHEAQRGSPKIICGVEEEFGEKHRKEDKVLRSEMEVSICLILS